jgi:carboxypeptidase C (cathepsin A)
VIYIDQPVPTGFSYGTDIVNSTHGAAAFIWTAFQVLFESPEFTTYKSRQYACRVTYTFVSADRGDCRFIMATESYGGHYGPEFVTYFNEQNAAIARGGLLGERVVVSALMINK